MKIGSAPSPQVAPSTQSTQSPSAVQPSSKLQGVQGGSKLQGQEQYQGAVEDLAQHLAADRSLNPGQVRDQAAGALSDLTGLGGGALQELVRQTVDRVKEIHLSSGDRWLRSETPDTFGTGGTTLV